LGRIASFLGGLSQQADHLADTIGSNDTSSLGTRAEESAYVGELTEV
jgi:hypothetical protein